MSQFLLLRAKPVRTWTVEALREYASQHFDAVGPPGEVFQYADTDYDLLGLAIEAVTGEPFHVVVRRHVLAPLELERTWYYVQFVLTEYGHHPSRGCVSGSQNGPGPPNPGPFSRARLTDPPESWPRASGP